MRGNQIGQLLQHRVELVGVGLRAGVPSVGDHGRLGEEHRRVRHHRHRRRWVQPVFGEVPVVVEGPGQRVQVLQLDTHGQRRHQDVTDRVVVQQSALDHRPALLAGRGGPDLVEHLQARRDLGLDRVQGQDPLRERVQGADGGEVDLVEGLLGALPLLSARVRVMGGALERGAQPVRELGGRLLGEGDRGDVLDGHPVTEHQGAHPMDQGSGLARPRPGVDEQRPVGGIPDQRPGSVVRQRPPR